MKKRTLALMLSAALCVGMLAGCGGGTQGSAETPDTNSPSAETPAGEEPAEVSGTVNTDGSTSMADVMAAFQETFGDLYPDVTVNYSGTGSGSGITNALAGTVDIGLSSRALTDDEKAEGAVENIVALDGVAIVVNPENTVTDAAPTPPSPSSAATPPPAPAAPSRRSWALRTPASIPTSTSPPAR